MSNLNDFLPNSQSFEIQTITSGSSDTNNPTVLDAGKDMYFWDYSIGSFRYFELPDGTTVGQQTILAHRPKSSGTAPQVRYTVYPVDGSPTMTYRSLASSGGTNYLLIWDGSAWNFTSEDN